MRRWTQGLPGAQVYVRSYPGLNGPWRISTAGGTHARWSPDGRELYYLNADGTAVMAAAITTDGTSLAAATPRALINTRVRLDHYPGGTPYDVAPDGRLLVIEVVGRRTRPGQRERHVVVHCRPELHVGALIGPPVAPPLFF